MATVGPPRQPIFWFYQSVLPALATAVAEFLRGHATLRDRTRIASSANSGPYVPVSGVLDATLFIAETRRSTT